MNRYPLIFARTRPQPELTAIRDSFEAGSKLESSLLPGRNTPRAVKLKRPGTSPKSCRPLSAAPGPAHMAESTNWRKIRVLRSEERAKERLALTTSPENWALAVQPVVVDGLPWKAHAGLKEGTANLPNRLLSKRHFEHVFGHQIRNKAKRAALVQFLTLALGIPAPSSRLHISQRTESQEVSLLFTGPKSPLSPCCESAVVFTFSKDLGGKVLCVSGYCPIRTIANFYVPVQLRRQIWSENSDSLCGLSLATSPRPQSTRSRFNPKSTTDAPVSGLFTNEKLRHVSPGPISPSAVPIFFRVRTGTPGRPGLNTSPLLQVLDRGNSRHNAVRRDEGTEELLQQLLLLTSLS